jgi:hypothetical protein
MRPASSRNSITLSFHWDQKTIVPFFVVNDPYERGRVPTRISNSMTAKVRPHIALSLSDDTAIP